MAVDDQFEIIFSRDVAVAINLCWFNFYPHSSVSVTFGMALAYYQSSSARMSLDAGG